MSSFSLTPKQVEANRLLASAAKHILLRGGSRSGKTFLMCRGIALRALKRKSTHTVLRLRFNHLKESVIGDTFPKVFRLCFPGVPYELNQTDWFIRTVNGSRILFGGLDDKLRTEKILGQEHSTILLNECSQISYASRNMAMTRLAQNSGLALKAYYDCNPPTVGHWTYRMFEKHLEPLSGQPLRHPEAYATMMMNPVDNQANLPPDYIDSLHDLPLADRIRFLEGQYLSKVEGALWDLGVIEEIREPAPKTQQDRDTLIQRMKNIVVAVDPSGCDGPEDFRSDEIGIVVVGMDHYKNGYILEDLSGRYSPNGWAKAAISCYLNWNADRIVAERNFGGAMVSNTLRTVDGTIPVKVVSASRGKFQRAEPVATLYERKRVKHVGYFPDLEEQYLNFSRAGYQGGRSPDRADAAIWGLSDLLVGQHHVSIQAPIVVTTPRFDAMSISYRVN